MNSYSNINDGNFKSMVSFCTEQSAKYEAEMKNEEKKTKRKHRTLNFLIYSRTCIAFFICKFSHFFSFLFFI